NSLTRRNAEARLPIRVGKASSSSKGLYVLKAFDGSPTLRPPWGASPFRARTDFIGQTEWGSWYRPTDVTRPSWRCERGFPVGRGPLLHTSVQGAVCHVRYISVGRAGSVHAAVAAAAPPVARIPGRPLPARPRLPPGRGLRRRQRQRPSRPDRPPAGR